MFSYVIYSKIGTLFLLYNTSFIFGTDMRNFRLFSSFKSSPQSNIDFKLASLHSLT